MAQQGNNLIVDDVLCNGEMPEYLELLSTFDVHLVGVFAPLEVLEAREAGRGDRAIGWARGQNGIVHRGGEDAWKVDTRGASADACAEGSGEGGGVRGEHQSGGGGGRGGRGTG